MKLNDTTEIIKISLIDEDTGKEEELFKIRDSKCYFCKEFEFNGYIIHLRLDWGDIKDGEPRLDADIWKKPQKTENRLRNGEWHHTSKQYDEDTGKTVYKFIFKNLKLLLSTKKTVGVTITSNAKIKIVTAKKSEDNREGLI